MAQPAFKKGDRVEWSSGQGTATGTVQEHLTKDKQVEGNTVSASKGDPRYLVKNDSTGNVTGHRPDALSKASAQSSSQADSSGRASSSAESGADSFEVGDRVQWNTSQGKTTGIVKEKLTETTDIKGYTAKATESEPQYLVESESTGSEAAHKPDALEPAE